MVCTVNRSGWENNKNKIKEKMIMNKLDSAQEHLLEDLLEDEIKGDEETITESEKEEN